MIKSYFLAIIAAGILLVVAYVSVVAAIMIGVIH